MPPLPPALRQKEAEQFRMLAIGLFGLIYLAIAVIHCGAVAYSVTPCTRSFEGDCGMGKGYLLLIALILDVLAVGLGWAMSALAKGVPMLAGKAFMRRGLLMGLPVGLVLLSVVAIFVFG